MGCSLGPLRYEASPLRYAQCQVACVRVLGQCWVCSSGGPVLIRWVSVVSVANVASGGWER